MSEQLAIVIFSYNRAMQLDYLIRSIREFVKVDSYDITVIYHCTAEHRESYAYLKAKHQGLVSFLERTKGNNFVTEVLPTLFRYYGNAYWYFKYDYLRKGLDNFKTLFERYLGASKAGYVLLLTDDAILYRDFTLPPDLLRRLRAEPTQCSYTAMVGRNIIGVPRNVVVESDLCFWNYHDKASDTHWNWVFGVDGRVYDRGGLLRVVRRYLYESAITLEAFGVRFARRRRLFSYGISPITSQVISVAINRVSTITNNSCANVDLDLLRTMFVEGYELDYRIPEVVTQAAHFVPDEVRLVRGGEVITLLSSVAGL